MPTLKNVGEPCAGEPHARIDGGERNQESVGHAARHRAPLAYPTRPAPGRARIDRMRRSGCLPATVCGAQGLPLCSQPALNAGCRNLPRACATTPISRWSRPSTVVAHAPSHSASWLAQSERRTPAPGGCCRARNSSPAISTKDLRTAQSSFSISPARAIERAGSSRQ